MNPFIEALNLVLEQTDQYTKEQEDELLDFIFDNSPYQDAHEFAEANISYYDALNLVQSNDCYLADAEDYVSTNSTNIVLPEDPDKLAYHLAYVDPEYGAKLFTELAYYQSKGRF